MCLLIRLASSRSGFTSRVGLTAKTRSSFSVMHRAPHAMVSRPEPDNVTINTPRDPNTLSNYNNFITTHTAVDFKIDFEKNRMHGSVLLDLKSITDAETKKIVLDTSYLQIDDVSVDGSKAKWNLASRFEPYGSPLSVKLDKGVPKGESVKVNVGLRRT